MELLLVGQHSSVEGLKAEYHTEIMVVMHNLLMMVRVDLGVGGEMQHPKGLVLVVVVLVGLVVL
jgi:hypothetical protein